eukprot:49124_1
MGGCLFVLITYMYNASLREHPAVLIFSRCIFDFLFGLSFFIHYFLDARDLACHPEHCTTLGTIILFCFLCSQGYFAASIHDLYLSLRNPFSQPHTLVGRTHIYIMMISATLTLFVDLNYSFSYRLDLQYCAISSSQTDVNPYNLMLVYVPICLLIILSISVNIYAIKRLRDGLADTFYIRMQAIKDSLFYCLGYTVYFMVLGLSYLMVWRDDQIHNDSQLKDENGWHYLFALTVAFLGVNTLLVWLYRQFISTGDAQDSKYKTCCNRLSLKPTIGDKSSNKALLREVLAYSSDGIAQSNESIDRQTKMDQTFYTKETFRLEEGVLDEDYPQSMNDPHGRTIQIFCIVIKYNRHLLYEEGANADSTSDADDSKKAIKKKPNHLELAADLAGSEDAEKPDLPRVHTKMIIGKDNTFGKGREFVDFAPIVFKYIRNHVLGISDKDYKASMIPTDKYAQRNVLDAKFGEGKSGAFFYFSHDSRYLVKTIKKFEVEVMLDTLKQYVQYIVDNPNTILSRVIGLHSIRMYGLTKYFVVTENVFLSDLKPSEVYDLKGSWVNRYTKYTIESGKTLKDADLKRFIVLNDQCRDQLIHQLQSDSKFLAETCDVMDYSLLLGIYHMKMVPNQDLKRNVIQEEAGDDPELEEKEMESQALLNDYAGGIRAEIIEGPGLYYMGIIDTLQNWSLSKKMEHFAKTWILRKDKLGISCVEPITYQKRFMNYMKNIIVTDNEYFSELNVGKKDFQNQSMLVYPGREVVARSIEHASHHASRPPSPGSTP